MSLSPDHHLRVELTVFDPRLFREKAEWPDEPRSTLLFCTPYADAVAPPFPAEGKAGISVWVGSLEAFKEPRARLLWELEKRRKRPAAVVLTGQKGRSFMRASRELATVLGETVTPLSFLRRRGQEWDSLDFLSAGDSSFMEGANPRLKRLKQSGWEAMVDRLTLVDSAIKQEYFETLHVGREALAAAAAAAFASLKLSPLVGIAGEGLTRESLFGLMEEPLLRRMLEVVVAPPAPAAGGWLLLSNRKAGGEVLLYGRGVEPLKVGQIMLGNSGDKIRGELAVAEIFQTLYPRGDALPRDAAGNGELFCWARVDWRYPPDREIPTIWKQKTALSAGSHPTHG